MDKKERLFRLATDSYRRSDEKLWVAAYACGSVVGRTVDGITTGYERGTTLGLASDMGVSVDTIEDMAHAYWIYKDLCELEDGKFRKFVRNARKAPYIYYSHFRALWDAQSHYKLKIHQVLDLLMDLVQAEGQISSRGIDGHTRGRFGDTRGWEFYAAKAEKELGQTLQQPDLPNVAESVGNAYQVTLHDIDGKNRKVLVVASNPQRAENIARKNLSKIIDPKIVKNAKASIIPYGEIITDSKNLLNMTYSWLGNEA